MPQSFICCVPIVPLLRSSRSKGDAVDERARVDLACVHGLAAGYNQELEVGASGTVL